MIQNLGSGGTAVRGDGTRYCDMTGDGKDDLIVRVATSYITQDYHTNYTVNNSGSL